jgi:hypothetical protein
MGFLIGVAADVGAEAGAGVAAEGAAETGTAEGAEEESISEIPQEIGDGDHIQLSEEQIRGLLWDDRVIEAITARANEICATANSMAITKGAVYGVTSPTEGAVTRPRANVWTKNYKAVIDDHYHATLLKAAAQFPSDPLPEGYGRGEGEPGEEESSEGNVAEEEAGEEAGAEAGEEAAAGSEAEAAAIALL